MLGDSDSRARFERGECPARYDTGNRNELIAACTQKMVVMRGDKLKSRPTVVEQNFAKRAVGDKFFGGAKDR